MTIHAVPVETPVGQPLPTNQLYQPTGIDFGNIRATPVEPLPVQTVSTAPTNRQGPASFVTELFKGIPSMFLRGGEAVLGVGQMLNPVDVLDTKMRDMTENIESFRERLFPMPDDAWGWAGRVTGEAIPYIATAIASAGAGAIGPFLTAFTVEGGSAYNEAKKSQAPEWKAIAEGTLTGTINGAIEMIGITKLLKFGTKGKVSARELVKNIKGKLWKQVGNDLGSITGEMLKSAITEGLQESMQEGVSFAIPAVVSNRFPKNPDGTVNWTSVINDIGVAGLGGAIAGGLITGGRILTEGVGESAKPTRGELDRFKQTIEQSKMPYKRKQLLLQELEDRFGEPKIVETAIKEVPQIPQPQQNVYQGKDSGKVYIEPFAEAGTPQMTRMETVGEGTKVFHNETNEELISKPELTRQAGETEEDYLKRTKQMQPSVANKFNDVVIKLNKAIDEVEKLRPEEEVVIKKERGKRFAEFRNIVSQIDNPTVAAFVSRSALAGELKMEIKPLSESIGTDDIDILFEKARQMPLTETEYLAVTDGMSKLFFKGKIPARHEVDAMGLIFPKETVQKLIDAHKRLGEEKFNVFLEALNIPRAILASFDMSAPLRQGLLLFFRNPKLWAKSLFKGYRAFANPEYADFIDMQIRTHPRFKTLKKSGLILTRIGGLTSGEEVFRSDVADRIPGLGKGIRASERAYVTVLNSLRAYNFYNIAEQWQGTGKTIEDYKQLAAYLNHATGRGDIKALRKIMPALGVTMFAPRLQIGRVQVFSDLITKPVMRRMIASDLLMFAGTAIGLLGLLSLRKEVTVKFNPLSTDFAKIRIGNTRIDFMGGYQQLIRYTAQLIMGKTKSSESGRIIPAERGAVLWRFIQSKLSPAAGLAVDLVRGETFLGKSIEPTVENTSREFYERLMPLFIQDVIDVSKDRGFDVTSLSSSLLALHGVNTQTYPITASSEASRLRDFYARRDTKKSWDGLGPDLQKMLKELHPDITLMEAKARMTREGTAFLGKMVKEQDATSHRVTRSLPKNIQQEMERLAVRIPGLSRHVGMDWYLNEERYKYYEQQTSKLLNDILPKVVLTPLWNSLPDPIRTIVLNELITNIKENVRKEISIKATMKDIEELT